MNICLIGDNITSLTLAKNLVNKNIKVLFTIIEKIIFSINLELLVFQKQFRFF